MSTTRDRVAAHRARMRQRGYREIRVWVPDVRTAEFANQARRASAAMNAADARDDIAAFLTETSWADSRWDDTW
jgi:hypothetical protein